jgi:hypothetical protein
LEVGGGSGPIIDSYAAHKGGTGNNAYELAFALVPMPGADEIPHVIAYQVETDEAIKTGLVHERYRTPVVDREFTRYEVRY